MAEVRVVVFAFLLTACDPLLDLHTVELSSDTATVVHDDAPSDTAAIRSDAAITPGDAALPSCPSGYVALGNHGTMYKKVTTAADFATARGSCDSDAVGIMRHTHLVVLDDDAERDTIFSNFGAPLWLGLVRIGLQNAFQPITDQSTTYPPQTVPPWGAGEPSGQVGENCVQNLTGMGALDDQKCTLQLAYVCECDDYADDPAH